MAFNKRWKIQFSIIRRSYLKKLSGECPLKVAIITRSEAYLIQFLIKILPRFFLYCVGQGVKGDTLMILKMIMIMTIIIIIIIIIIILNHPYSLQ